MVYVYVLQSFKDLKYYIGITSDLDKRVERHNRGDVKSTRDRKPFKVIHFEKFVDYISAREREKETKSYKGGHSFRALIDN